MQRRKINPESLGSVFSPCCRAGIDAALAKADFFFADAPTIENIMEQKIQNTKVASAKVAFDTVRYFGNPQMWEWAHVGFGHTRRKRTGACTKQCASRKHCSSDTRLAEACAPKHRDTAKYRVEGMRAKWPFWMRLVEAQCAHRKHCYPEIPLGSHLTSRVSRVLTGNNCTSDFTGIVLPHRVLSATFILSKNSRVLDAKSRLKSANLG